MASMYANPIIIKPTYHTFKKWFFSKKDEENFSDKKRKFLKKYTSPTGKNKYKRYLWSPLRYAWWKSLATWLIVELLPDNLTKIVSPFFWWWAFEIACAKELWLEVIGYDIFDLLVNYWQYQVHNPAWLYEHLKKFSPSKEWFAEVKNILKNHWLWKEVIDDNLYLASIFYFNHNTSYWPHTLWWPSSVYLQEKRYETMINKVKEFEWWNLNVYCDDFMNIMAKHSNDFMYCDPPYFLEWDSKTFVWLYPHRNFPIHHNWFNHEWLRDYLRKHKWWFILSYNDCSTIREWYKDFDMITPSWQYTFSQWDTRIWENRLSKNNWSHVKESHELIIYKLPN